MKKLAVIYDEKEQNYEIHRYNIFFKILPLGNPITYISIGSTIESAKRVAAQRIKGKIRFIEVFDADSLQS